MMKKILTAALFCAATALFGAGVSLDGDWQLSFWPQPEKKITNPADAKPEATIKAKVPGNVELDMLAAGLIKDPMKGDNVYSLRKYEGYQWLYTRTFDAPELADGERAILNLKGVDTIADIFINGKKAGSVENMLIPHEIDITDFIKKSENKIEILIHSAVIEAGKYRYPEASSPGPHRDALEVRKAPHMYGWDIMPRLVSAGLWKSVSVDVQKPVRISDIVYMVHRIDLKKKTANVMVQVDVRTPFSKLDSLRYNVEVFRNGKKVVDIKNSQAQTYAWRCYFDIKNAEFWWPRTMGEPTLYDAHFTLTDESGKVLDSRKTKIGLRTVELERTDISPDNAGKFQFKINGQPMFAFGTNWVQLDGLHSRDPQHLESALEMMKDLNCNIVRCWGGNVYESDAFYDFCDANGIVIWQDFTMACSLPAQSDRFNKQLAEEATSVVRRLRNHPSLILWAGDNENDVSMRWGFRAFKPNPAMNAATREVLPRVLFSEDLTRPYLPSSPYISPEVHNNPDVEPAEYHLWGPRGYYKAAFYTKNKSIFASEIGYHGCPNRESLEKMFDADFVYPWTDKEKLVWNDQWQCKATMPFKFDNYLNKRNSLMTNQIKKLFGDVPRDLDDFIFASQSVQGEAKKYFIEMFRTQKGAKTGIIWWNLRDGWPILSDAIVDYYNSKKRAYEYIKRVQENCAVMVNDKLEVVCANEPLKPATVSVKITDIESGKVLLTLDSAKIDANSVKTLAKLGELEGQGMLLIEYTVDGKRNLKNHYLYGKPPFKLSSYKLWAKKL